jgi:hypothetical protein
MGGVRAHDCRNAIVAGPRPIVGPIVQAAANRGTPKDMPTQAWAMAPGGPRRRKNGPDAKPRGEPYQQEDALWSGKVCSRPCRTIGRVPSSRARPYPLAIPFNAPEFRPETRR